MTDNSTYHHGDLREALLKCALERIEEVGFEKLELRDLAAMVGVSRGAPYRHFKTRGELLEQLAIRGSQHLDRLIGIVSAGRGTPKQKLVDTSRRYLEFAEQHTQLYRLMSVADIFQGKERSAEWRAVSMHAFLTHESIMALNMPNSDATAVRSATLFSWSVLHGFASLSIHGRLKYFLLDGQRKDDLFEDFVARALPARLISNGSPSPRMPRRRRAR